jgi:hypothetical protein
MECGEAKIRKSIRTEGVFIKMPPRSSPPHEIEGAAGENFSFRPAVITSRAHSRLKSFFCTLTATGGCLSKSSKVPENLDVC